MALIAARSGTVIEPKLLEKLKGLTEALNRIPGAVRPNQRSLASSKTKNIVGTEEGMSARAMLAKLPQARRNSPHCAQQSTTIQSMTVC